MTAHDPALVERLTSELGKHHRTRGLAVSMGATCACGFWEKGRKQTGGSDGLDSHRAEVVLEAVADDLREQGAVDALRAAADDLDALHPGEIKPSQTVRWLRARAASIEAGGKRCQFISPTPWGPSQCALPDGHDERHAFSPSEGGEQP